MDSKIEKRIQIDGCKHCVNRYIAWRILIFIVHLLVSKLI